MAERVTDLRDIERRVVAHLVGEPEPGVPTPDRAVDPGGRGPRARRHRRAWTPRWSSRWSPSAAAPTSHTAIIARQLGIPCVVGVAGVDRRSRPAPRAGRRRAPARSSSAPDPDEAARAGRGRPRSRGPRSPRWTGPGRDRRRHAGQAAGQRRRRRVRPRRARRAPVEGVGLFRTELCFLNRAGRADASRSRPTIYGEVLDAFGDGRYVVVRTLDAGSDKPVEVRRPTRARRTPRSACAACGCRFDNPGLLDRQLDGIAAAAERDRHRDLGDGADGRHRRRGRATSPRRSAPAGSSPA